MKRKKKIKRKKVKVPRDYHHILNKCNGGDNHISNLLYLRISRHRALHKLFENQTLQMMFILIKELNFRVIMSDENNLDNWHSLFGDRCKKEALALLERVIRAKEAQRRE